jgi:type III secretory pathway component EscU
MLSYDGVEIGVPVISRKYKGGQVASAVADAKRNKIPVDSNWDFLRETIDKVPTGNPIPEKFYDTVAGIMFKHGII